MSKIVQDIEAAAKTRKLPEFAPGETGGVQDKVKEGERERVKA